MTAAPTSRMRIRTLLLVGCAGLFLSCGSKRSKPTVALLDATSEQNSDGGAAVGSRGHPKDGADGAVSTSSATDADSDEATGDERIRVVAGQIGERETFVAMLTREEVEKEDQNLLISALGGLLDFRAVRETHTYELRMTDEGELDSMTYVVSPVVRIEAKRKPEGGFAANRVETPVETKVVEIGGPIEGTLYESIKKTGESTALVGTIVDVFAWDINFYTDQHPGDRYKVIIEKRSVAGKTLGYGRLLAAEYSGKVGSYRAFYFARSDKEKGSYYDERGQNIVKSLLKTPLRFVRVSSGFNPKRMHPILHTVRGHMGVDFAAPVGTPIWATADGKVVTKVFDRGKGNYIEIQHANGLKSGYMHMSKFAKGIKAGQLVHQKQVIGYVGTTGLSTGPHLHFSLRQNGSYVDPQKVKMRRDAPVSKNDRAAFDEVVRQRQAGFKRIDEKR